MFSELLFSSLNAQSFPTCRLRGPCLSDLVGFLVGHHIGGCFYDLISCSSVVGIPLRRVSENCSLCIWSLCESKDWHPKMPGGAGEVAGEQSDASGYTTAVQGYWQLMWEEEKDSRSREDGGGGFRKRDREAYELFRGRERYYLWLYKDIWECRFFFLMLRI